MQTSSRAALALVAAIGWCVGTFGAAWLAGAYGSATDAGMATIVLVLLGLAIGGPPLALAGFALVATPSSTGRTRGRAVGRFVPWWIGASLLGIATVLALATFGYALLGALASSSLMFAAALLATRGPAQLEATA